MCRDAPFLSAEPVPFDRLTLARRARALEWFADPTGAAILLVHAPAPVQRRKASASDVDAIGRSIPVIDAIGVTMGAVKELDATVEKLAKGLPAYDRKAGDPIGRGGRGIR